ncbi:hypothetical protein TSUD_131420 [Trifolium subterraneum]|uniref:Uncharacterized protein n=1 Tax=Trifolium subterraneum TaxID=3900 RepID=A0A2Z6PTL5_TRISU|nr:hypothetical protein TSUD_131420 [Trifolium subterraneum]
MPPSFCPSGVISGRRWRFRFGPPSFIQCGCLPSSSFGLTRRLYFLVRMLSWFCYTVFALAAVAIVICIIVLDPPSPLVLLAGTFIGSNHNLQNIVLIGS